VYPISPAKSYRAHRVLGQVVAQSQLRMFQEATEPTPKGQRVVACLGCSIRITIARVVPPGFTLSTLAIEIEMQMAVP
jgi:hypothetical protein